MSQRGFDVAVVGAGIVGSAIAYECARRGARVVLLDRDQPGAHASGAAAGMLAPCSEAHAPGPFLDVARESLALWPSFAAAAHEDSGVDPELRLDGLLRVALTDEDGQEVRNRLAWQRSCGIAAGRWVSAGEAREIEPALHPAVAGAAWYAGEGHVHSRHAVRAFVAAAVARGAELRSGAIVEGTVPVAGRVVLAAGAWLGEVAAQFGVAVPVEPVHGQLLVLRGVAVTPRRVLYAGLRGYVVAKDDGTVLAGASEEHRGFDTEADPAQTRRLLAQAGRLLEVARHAEAVPWTGLRPATPDRLPVLGVARPGVIVAGGHYRNGVLLAPATARGIADIALEGRAPDGWEAFDPLRFERG